MCDRQVRLITKQGNGVPTIPNSNNHKNGDWIATDIYDGELYLDNDTGILWTSNKGVIQPAISRTKGTWIASITQTRTNAPVLTIIANTLGVTVTTAYNSIGSYTLSGFNGLLVGKVKIKQSFQLSYLNNAIPTISTPSLLTLNTYSSGVLTNDIITNGILTIEIY